MSAPNRTDFVAFDALFSAHARTNPQALALTDSERSLSYAQLDGHIRGAAVALATLGVRRGDVVAIAAGNCIDYLVAYLALLRLGAGSALLPISASAESFGAMIDNSGASIALVDADGAKLLDGGRTGLTVIPLAQVASQCLPAHHGDAPADAEPDAIFNIIYSSGTTGTPKGIIHTHAMRWHQFRDMSAMGYGPQAICIASTPLYSNTTLVGLLPALMFGGAVVLMKRFDTRQFLQLCASFRVTHAMLVPAQIKRILADPDFTSTDLTAFQLKISTSAPLAPEIKRDVLDRWPGGLVEFYGMTEGGGSCILVAHAFPGKLHTVGRPLPGHDIRVIDDDGQELPVGAIGEIVGRSNVTMRGYRNAPDRSAAARWQSPDGKVFLRTGDIGRFDEDGFLTLLDRRKDMIISGGFNLYPSDIEAVLVRHADVSEAAVVGVPSERWGESPVAFIIGQPGARFDPATIVEWVNAKVGRNQRIARAVALTELPRNAIGKVLKRELRDRFLADFGPLP